MVAMVAMVATAQKENTINVMFDHPFQNCEILKWIIKNDEEIDEL
jgi:hypothetical protein